MTRAEKARKIAQLLDHYIPQTPVPLHHSDAYTLLVAVALSAQTTDDRVNLVTPNLFKKASTPEAMSQLTVEEILDCIRTCGLAPTKAKNLKAMAERLVEHFDGQVPQTFEELESLPGVGHKTAGVVRTQAFGLEAFPVDTHIHRLAARWGLSNGTTVEKTEKDLKAVFPRKDWGKLHLQIIYFGRAHCPARGHDLTKCPICSWAATKKRLLQEAQRKAVRTRR